MENEHGEIRKDDVEDKDFNTIVNISSLNQLVSQPRDLMSLRQCHAQVFTDLVSRFSPLINMSV